MSLCQVYPASGGLVRDVLNFIDCQTLTLGANGYQAMASPGSATSQMLTGLLTLFVALFGYRMLFGRTPEVRDGLLALVKVGIVLTLATNWPAYRTLAYNVVLQGPAQLAASIGSGADIPGANSGLVARLDNADAMLSTLAGLGAGSVARPATSPFGTLTTNDPGAPADPVFTGFDAWAIGLARLAFLVGSIGAFAGVRFIAALLLALGPLFVAFLLFEGARGMFVGWLRVLAGAVLGAAFIGVVLGIELALLEPWLIDLIGRRYTNQGIGGIPTQLLAIALVFDLALLAVIVAAGRVTAGLGLAFPAAQGIFARTAELARSPSQGFSASTPGRLAEHSRSRALVVADAVAAVQRREGNAMPGGAIRNVSGPPISTRRHQAITAGSEALGQSARRRTTRC